PQSSAPDPRETGRFSNAADGGAAEENRRREQSDRQPIAEKKRRRERSHARTSSVVTRPDKYRGCRKVNGKCKRKFRPEAKCPDAAVDRRSRFARAATENFGAKSFRI